MSVASDELIRLARDGHLAPTDENLAELGLERDDLDLFAMWDAENTMSEALPIATGVPAEVLDHVNVFAVPRESLVGLLATHTAVGVMAGLRLAKVRRG